MKGDSYLRNSIDRAFQGDGGPDDVFVMGDLAINATGVYIKNSSKTFRLSSKDIIEGSVGYSLCVFKGAEANWFPFFRKVIGCGASSCVKGKAYFDIDEVVKSLISSP